MTDMENNLTGYEEHLRDSEYTGDARRCPRHPNVKTSSADGMFDGLCGECEAEMENAQQLQDWWDNAAGQPGAIEVAGKDRRDAVAFFKARGYRNVRVSGSKVVWS